MDHATLMVWIDDNAQSERELAGRLCRRHADALVVPRGWSIDDRREVIPRLFRSVAREVEGASVRPKRVVDTKPQVDKDDSPSLFDAVDTPDAPVDQGIVGDGEAHTNGDTSILDEDLIEDHPATSEDQGDPAMVDPDETQAMPWTPQLTGRYSPDDTGPVSGRLLGRAFGVRKGDQ